MVKDEKFAMPQSPRGFAQLLEHLRMGIDLDAKETMNLNKSLIQMLWLEIYCLSSYNVDDMFDDSTSS